MLYSLFVLHFRDEDNFSVAFTNCFESIQIPNLHCCLIELLSGQPHQLGRLDISPGRNNLTLSQSPLFSCTGQRILKITTKLYIFNEISSIYGTYNITIYISSPFFNILINLLLDLIGNLLSFF